MTTMMINVELRAPWELSPLHDQAHVALKYPLGVNRNLTVSRDAVSVRQPLPTQDVNVVSDSAAARCTYGETLAISNMVSIPPKSKLADNRANARKVSMEITVDFRKFSYIINRELIIEFTKCQ